jgi:hypothetical protein
VSLQGTLEEVKDPAGKKKVRQQFVEMVARKKLSPHVLTAPATGRATARTYW